LDGTEVEGFGTCGVLSEFSLEPVAASFEITGCALECLQK